MEKEQQTILERLTVVETRNSMFESEVIARLKKLEEGLDTSLRYQLHQQGQITMARWVLGALATLAGIVGGVIAHSIMKFFTS